MPTSIDSARYILPNARITRVKAVGKVTFLTAYCYCGKFPNYYDVTVFADGPQPPREGEAVTVSGELRPRKPKDGAKGPWALSLIAHKFEPGDDRKAPRPKPRGQQQPLPVQAPDPDDMPPF